MTRIAAVLAAALVSTGCIVTSDNPPASTGSVILYWDFLRYAPSNAAQQNGFILYDASLVGASANAPCPESGVETVDVTTPNGTHTFYCLMPAQQGKGVQGVILDNLPTGNVTIRLQGWRRDGGVDRALWDGNYTVNVRGGVETQAVIDVDPVTQPIDVGGTFFTTQTNQFYATCNEASNPRVDYEVRDGLGEIVLVDSVACPVGAGASPLPIIADTLDLDVYTIRLKGYTGNPAQRTFDACVDEQHKTWAFDHFTNHSGANALTFQLTTGATGPKCSP
ncbi:MAG: hypothetical protein U0229_12600 [Anaeromyxobacter sp.]